MHLLQPIRHVKIPYDPSVWQSLPGRFPADDTLFELIANILTPEPLTFFQQI